MYNCLWNNDRLLKNLEKYESFSLSLITNILNELCYRTISSDGTNLSLSSFQFYSRCQIDSQWKAFCLFQQVSAVSYKER